MLFRTPKHLKGGFIEDMEMDEITTELKRWVSYLDDHSKAYDARWGIGRLLQCVSGQLQEKWQRQQEKLFDALNRRDLPQTAELVQGSIRALAVFEAAAIKDGHTPIEPDFWEVMHPDSGNIYRIAKNMTHAKGAVAQNKAVYTLEEVARIIEAYDTPSPFTGQPLAKEKVSPIWDGKTSDEIPFL